MASSAVFVGAGEGLVELEQRRAFGGLGLAGGARVGHDAHDELAQLFFGGEQRDGVVVALAHLAAVQPGQGGHVVFDHHRGQREVFAVEVVEARRDVARHFDVLDLVAAYRHLVGVEHQDVCRHQHRVHEQTGGDTRVRVFAGSVVFVDRGLVGVSAVEQAFAGDAGQQPGQFRDFRDVGLAVEGDLVRVQPAGQPGGRDLQRGALHPRRFAHLDEGVVVGQEIEIAGVGLAAGAHRGADGAHVVAQVGRARCGDAGEDATKAHGVQMIRKAGRAPG